MKKQNQFIDGSIMTFLWLASHSHISLVKKCILNYVSKS